MDKKVTKQIKDEHITAARYNAYAKGITKALAAKKQADN